MVARLRTAARPEPEVGPDEILETLLVRAGAAGNVPTDEKRLLSFLGLRQLSFDFLERNDLPEDVRARGEIRAALHLAKRAVAIQAGMGEKRSRFCVFHEIAHCVLPEHNQKLFVDDDQTLNWWTKARLEREANRFAADLLFQGRFFTEQALSMKTSLSTVVELAPQFGASYEAAFRRYTEMHVIPCALLVYDKLEKAEASFVENDEYSLQYTITSQPFRRSYFSSVQMKEDRCKASDIYGQPWHIGQIVPKELTIEADQNKGICFETELFSNGYKIFQFVLTPASRSK